jgi:adenylate cyclase
MSTESLPVPAALAPVILVVDDEPDLEQLLSLKFRRRIRSGELRFHFASDGEDALRKLSENPDVEIVVTDINMPRMDGLTLVMELRKRHPLVKAVIVSAYGDLGNIRTAMNRGAFDFLTKPLDFTDFERTVEKTVEHVRAI